MANWYSKDPHESGTLWTATNPSVLGDVTHKHPHSIINVTTSTAPIEINKHHHPQISLIAVITSSGAPSVNLDWYPLSQVNGSTSTASALLAETIGPSLSIAVTTSTAGAVLILNNYVGTIININTNSNTSQISFEYRPFEGIPVPQSTASADITVENISVPHAPVASIPATVVTSSTAILLTNPAASLIAVVVTTVSADSIVASESASIVNVTTATSSADIGVTFPVSSSLSATVSTVGADLQAAVIYVSCSIAVASGDMNLLADGGFDNVSVGGDWVGQQFFYVWESQLTTIGENASGFVTNKHFIPLPDTEYIVRINKLSGSGGWQLGLGGVSGGSTFANGILEFPITSGALPNPFYIGINAGTTGVWDDVSIKYPSNLDVGYTRNVSCSIATVTDTNPNVIGDSNFSDPSKWGISSAFTMQNNMVIQQETNSWNTLSYAGEGNQSEWSWQHGNRFIISIDAAYESTYSLNYGSSDYLEILHPAGTYTRHLTAQLYAPYTLTVNDSGLDAGTIVNVFTNPSAIVDVMLDLNIDRASSIASNVSTASADMSNNFTPALNVIVESAATHARVHMSHIVNDVIGVTASTIPAQLRKVTPAVEQMDAFSSTASADVIVGGFATSSFAPAVVINTHTNTLSRDIGEGYNPSVSISATTEQNLLIDGGFDDPSMWSNVSTMNVVDSQLIGTSRTLAVNFLQLSFQSTPFTDYVVGIDRLSGSGTGYFMTVGASPFTGYVNTNGPVQLPVNSGSSTNGFRLYKAPNSTGVWDDVYVKIPVNINSTNPASCSVSASTSTASAELKFTPKLTISAETTTASAEATRIVFAVSTISTTTTCSPAENHIAWPHLMLGQLFAKVYGRPPSKINGYTP